MATGVVYKDLLPIPDDDPRGEEGTTTTMTDAPTESHALAMQSVQSPAEKGAAQIDHEHDVVNLGWNEPKEAIANPLVGGLNNEDLWILVRRYETVSKMGCSKCITSKRSRTRPRVAWT
jgi:hypothetical protein